MSGYLRDTNCISELVRDKPQPSVMAWIETADETLLYLSVLPLGEIRKGLAGLAQSRRRTGLETWLEVKLRARFADRILTIDPGVADRWGLLAADARKQGKTFSAMDGLLAATALHHNRTIVSRNVSDFAAARVQMLKPWNAWPRGALQSAHSDRGFPPIPTHFW
jgi:toxin FitB